MNFPREASKILTNKYFLYFMVFLASTNVLGYLVTNKLNAVVFFALVSFLTYYFSKNYAVVLLIAVVATNFMMANNLMREGLEVQNTDDAKNTVLEKASSTDPQLADALNAVKNATSNDDLNAKIKAVAPGNDKSVVDINNTNLNKKTDEEEPMGVGEQVSNNKKGNLKENLGPRLDYAATIEQSYQNLDELLGSDSIKQLTNDTQKLMSQQQNLFNTMNQMVPVLQGAQDMLKGFDIGGLTNSLKGASALGAAPTVVGSK
jgi:hypothetical protein